MTDHPEPPLTSNDQDVARVWSATAASLDGADGIFYDLPTLNLEKLSDWLARSMDGRGLQPSPDLDLFADALFDLSQLAEEMRFGAGVGALYMIGLSDEISAVVPDDEGYSQLIL